MVKLRDKMIQHPDGMWEPKEPIRISTDKVKVALNPGSKMSENAQIAGVPLSQLLDMELQQEGQ